MTKDGLMFLRKVAAYYECQIGILPTIQESDISES